MHRSQKTTPLPQEWSPKNLALLAILTALGFLIMGYHPGLEDDAFYLAAIKRNLNPALFPHDADFFRLQFQATIFDKLIALSVQSSHIPLSWAALFWQVAAIFFLLHGCWRIARRCFARPAAQWGAVTMIAALLTLPIPGIAMTIADQYLHPRTLATAAILAAIVAVIDRRLWVAGLLLALAFSIHAIMASFGISFCAFLWWNLRSRSPEVRPIPIGAAALVPLGWIFEPASNAWRRAAATRSFYYVARWEWYEWLGVFAPLVLLYAFAWQLQRRKIQNEEDLIAEDLSEDSALRSLVMSLLYYGVFQTVAGLAIMLPPALERLRPFEPMRYLHLLYVLFFLIAGGLVSGYILNRKIYRWLLLFFPLSAGMLYAQHAMFPATEHVEFPGAMSQNEWLEAFAWIRQNTPVDALFALDPHYTRLPGEDYHGFRALAERSALADYDKDAGVAARVPRLAPRWLKEVTAENNWDKFQQTDFDRIKNEFGVTWIILSHADAGFSVVSPSGMSCPYANSQVRVCQLY